MSDMPFSSNGHKRVVLYARVSSDDTRKDGRNLQSQLDMCRQYATERGYSIVAELREDDRGASGASFDLPQLGHVLDMAEHGEFDIMIVRELDRLSRNLAKQLIVEESLKRNHVAVEYVLADYADTPEGNLQKHIRASVAEYERELIKIRLSRGRRNVVKGGRIMLHGDQPPYRYRTVKEQVRDGATVIIGIEPDETEARIIRLIFDWYTIGDESGAWLSTRRIAQRLTEMKIPTWADLRGKLRKTRKRGEWSTSAVIDILNSPVYRGLWAYGSQKVELKVPALVSDEQWQAAEVIRQDASRFFKKDTSHEYLMQGRVTCQCGKGMFACTHTNRLGKEYSYCVCYSKTGTAGGDCGIAHYRADHADALIWNWLKEYFKDPTDLRNKLETYRVERAKVNAPIMELIKTNEKLLAEHETQLERLKDMCQAGIIKMDEAIERKMRLEETITKLQRELGELQTRLGKDLSEGDIENVIQFALELSAGLAEADRSFVKRRQIIDVLGVSAIAKVEDDEKVVYGSFILTEGQLGQRLVMPARGRSVLAGMTSHLTTKHT